MAGGKSNHADFCHALEEVKGGRQGKQGAFRQILTGQKKKKLLPHFNEGDMGMAGRVSKEDGKIARGRNQGSQMVGGSGYYWWLL